jgi:hypothetical protein
MASTGDSTDGTDSTSGSSGGIFDSIVNFLSQPLGMGLAAGVVIAGFVAWRYL